MKNSTVITLIGLVDAIMTLWSGSNSPSAAIIISLAYIAKTIEDK